MIKLDLNRDNLTFIGLVVMVLLLLGQCNRAARLDSEIIVLKTDLNVANANTLAAMDSVEVIVNKNGYLQADIQSYQMTNTELLSKNAKLANEYAKALSLNKKLNNVNSLLRADLENKDSLLFYANINADSTFTFKDSADYGDGNSRSIILKGKIADGSINGNLSVYQTIRLWTAVEEKEGIKTLKLSTKYPMDALDIQGIQLINKELNTFQKKSRWNINFGVGVGVVPNATTGIAVTPFVGATLGWSPKWLQF
mgnify:CR=1 FL=1